MPRGGFEPTIPVFERPKTIRALDLAAIVIGLHNKYTGQISINWHLSVLYISECGMKLAVFVIKYYVYVIRTFNICANYISFCENLL
jgi:hypothetical protein